MPLSFQIYAGILLYFNKKHGQQTSGLLFLFWFFYTLFSLPRCITEIRRNDYRNDNNIENSWQYYQFISSIISFVVCSLILVLNFFADREPLNKKYSKSTVCMLILNHVCILHIRNTIQTYCRIHVQK